ncbi:hypothetical protein, partial [Pseudomonas brassicacearum]
TGIPNAAFWGRKPASTGIPNAAFLGGLLPQVLQMLLFGGASLAPIAFKALPCGSKACPRWQYD